MLNDLTELHHQGRLAEAENECRAYLAEHPNDAEAMLMLSIMLGQRNEVDEARQVAQRAHELAPERVNIVMTLATLDFREGKLDGARALYHQALALDPNLANAHIALGNIATGEGDQVLAEQHFRTALRVKDDPQALAGIGVIALQNDDVERSLQYLSRAAELAPNSAPIQVMLARAFVQKGTINFAEKALGNAMRLAPQDQHPRQLLASLLMQEKRYTEAEPMFRALLAVEATQLIGELGLADIARLQGHLDEAIRLYRSALEKDPGNPSIVEALAWCLLQQGQYTETMQTYESYLAHSPANVSIASKRAELLMRSGQKQQAIAAWRETLERDPSNAAARMGLAGEREAAGAFDEALALVDAAPPDVAARPMLMFMRVRAAMRNNAVDEARRLLDDLATQALDSEQMRVRCNYLGHLHDRAGEFEAATKAFLLAQEVPRANLPNLPESFDGTTLDRAGPPLPNAPVMLLGTPGSGVERIAALLADQSGLAVPRGRHYGAQKDDGFGRMDFSRPFASIADAEIASMRDRYFGQLRELNIPEDRTMVDWMPLWDARLLDFTRHVLPGTRFVIVQRDPRDALLNWLAFGWSAGMTCANIEDAATWLVYANRHLHAGFVTGDSQRIIVDADAVLDDPATAGCELARFLGLDKLQPGAQLAVMTHGQGGMPVRFAPGHWRDYATPLAAAFARLAPEA